MTRFRIRPIYALFALLLVCAFNAAPVNITTTFQFVGTCADCTGTATGTLILQNYTLGSQIQLSNFVSFTYNGTDILSAFTLTPSNIPNLISGSLPASLATTPGPASVSINANTSTPGFLTGSGGSWCAGAHCAFDHGNSHTWSLASSPSLGLSGPTSTAQVGVAYNSSLTATGGTSPYTFAITGGALPGGLTLNTSTGAITGTPNTPGPFTFTARVTDSAGLTPGNTPAQGARRTALAGSPAAASVSSSFTITVSPAPLSIGGPNANGQVGVPYNSSLTATGGVSPFTFAITGGALPGGLTLAPGTGAITGTPNTPGTFNFTARVTDSQESGNTPAQRARRAALAGSPAASTSTGFTITITPAATSTLGAPALSDWMLIFLAAAIAAIGGILARKAHART